MYRSLLSPRALRAVLASSVLAVAAVASATDVIHNISITAGGALETTDWTHSVTVPAADPSKGTLLGIDYTLNWTDSLGASFTSVAGSGGSFDIDHNLDIYLLDGSSHVITGGTFDHRAYAEATVAPNTTVPYAPIVKTGHFSGSFDSTMMSILPGSTFNIWATGYSTGTTTGQFDYHVDTKLGMNAVLTYHYQAVPEPTTMAALGLGAFGFLRRRKGGRA